VQGDEIQVVYPGRRRWDRGPDFAGALISWPGSVLRGGEVEVHVRSSDWRAHGHHRDRHYNGVLLQVVMWHDSPAPTLREDGVELPVLALAPHLTIPLAELLAHLQDPAPRPSPCWPEGRSAVGDLLDRCGLERFGAKAARFESNLACCPPEQLLYQAIAEALGYTLNRRPFRRLAQLVPLAMALAFAGRGEGKPRRDGEEMEALLLGAAGLLPSERGLGSGDAHAERLQDVWEREGKMWAGGAMLPSEWEFFRVRPANFPPRRMAGLALLVNRWPERGLVDTLEPLVLNLDPRRLPRAMEALLLGEARGGYWSNRCDFGLPMRRPAALIGRQRAAEIVVNVFLPFLMGWAAHIDDERLGRCALDAYRVYPKRGDNEISRYMAAQILGLPRPREARSACRQQGLIHLYSRYCEGRRCWECPVGSS